MRITLPNTLYYLPIIPASIARASTGTHIPTVLNYFCVAYPLCLGRVPRYLCHLELGTLPLLLPLPLLLHLPFPLPLSMPLPLPLSLFPSLSLQLPFPIHFYCIGLCRWMDSCMISQEKMCSSYRSVQEHLYRHEFENWLFLVVLQALLLSPDVYDDEIMTLASLWVSSLQKKKNTVRLIPKGNILHQGG